MNIFCKLTKLIIAGLIVFIASNFLIINPVFAKDIRAGFGAGTEIATPNGSIAVENLNPGDRVIGYNFETHRRRENTVIEIKQKPVLGYYLINDRTKLASPDLIYIRTLVAPELVRLNKVASGNRLFGNKRSIVVDSIEQKIEPVNIYQIMLDSRTGNMYADNILVHVGYDLPLYFQYQHIDCKPGTPYFKQCGRVNIKTLPGTFIALSIIAISLTIISKAVNKLSSYISKRS